MRLTLSANSRCLTAPLLVILFSISSPEGSGAIQFIEPEKSSIVSPEGTVSLVWEAADEQSPIRIERSASPQFEDHTLVYEGLDTATFVSGLPEGIHYFRAIYADQRDSPSYRADPPLRVEVDYVSMGLVIPLLAMGLLTFVCIATSIIKGDRRTNSSD